MPARPRHHSPQSGLSTGSLRKASIRRGSAAQWSSLGRGERRGRNLAVIPEHQFEAPILASFHLTHRHAALAASGCGGRRWFDDCRRSPSARLAIVHLAVEGVQQAQQQFGVGEELEPGVVRAPDQAPRTFALADQRVAVGLQQLGRRIAGHAEREHPAREPPAAAPLLARARGQPARWAARHPQGRLRVPVQPSFEAGAGDLGGCGDACAQGRCRVVGLRSGLRRERDGDGGELGRGAEAKQHGKVLAGVEGGGGLRHGSCRDAGRPGIFPAVLDPVVRPCAAARPSQAMGGHENNVPRCRHGRQGGGRAVWRPGAYRVP